MITFECSFRVSVKDRFLKSLAELHDLPKSRTNVFVCCSGGKEREGDLQYYPFRMTPYLMKVQDADLAEEQFCCLLLAERVHSGYEGEAGHFILHYVLLRYLTKSTGADILSLHLPKFPKRGRVNYTLIHQIGFNLTSS